MTTPMRYSVKEIYYTLQGEGAHSGRPAVFLRFTGCNLWSGLEKDRNKAVCKFCDTDFVGTNGPGGGTFETADELSERVADVWKCNATHNGSQPFVVCTGGEPLLQLDSDLIESLHRRQCKVAVETNGTIAAPAGIDWLCCSPKIGAKLVQQTGHELKLVYPQDGGMPDDFVNLDFQHFYLQPMDGPNRQTHTEMAIEYCRRQSPLFDDGSFEFICIPDNKRVSVHKYGTCMGKNGLPHSYYFPAKIRESVGQQHVHFDPEFETFTYGDPTIPKRSLRYLEQGDCLIFYCGLQNWDERTGWRNQPPAALYIVGYFVVEMAGLATTFSKETLRAEFGQNSHVRYPTVLKQQLERLVLVKGSPESRLLKNACLISSIGEDCAGRPLKVLSPKMQKIFGAFDGKVSIQRSPPRWVEPAFVQKAIRFVKRLK